MKRYIVTAALPYANGSIHLGHLAGVYLPADIYYRYLKSEHKDVIFICGSDEHGAAITLRALKDGETPKHIVDKNYELIKNTFQSFGIQFDIFGRTTSEIHHKTAKAFFLKLLEKGVFEEKEVDQFYDSKVKHFLADRYIVGVCPKCDYEEAYGDQCESCGSTLSPTDLINPKSTLSETQPILKKTKLWYLPLNKHEKWLKTWIQTGVIDGEKYHNPEDWRKPVLGHCMSWINGGLSSRAITRDLDWGVKVPVENAEGKVLYVWFDAPIGYISATKEWANKHNKSWEDYWKNKDTELCHFIGKDNIVFHAIIFPVLLKEMGGFVLPKNIPSNEFLNLEGKKFSTSKNYAVWLQDYLKDFPDKKDELRYVLTSIAPETKDSDFSWKLFQSKVNNELVSILGNFVNRTIVLANKYYNGKVPNTNMDSALEKKCLHIIDVSKSLIVKFKFKDALVELMKLARLGNKYMADSEPWKVIKTDPNLVEGIIYNSLQICFYIGKHIAPFLPSTSVKILELLGKTDYTSPLQSGDIIGKPFLLFQKIEDEMMAYQIKKIKKMSANINPSKENKKKVTAPSFDDFLKLDFRVVSIIDAKKHENADKLLILKVKTSQSEIRTIVSGIAKSYSPQELIGKQVMALLNLPSRIIRGEQSDGMLLLAESDEKLVLMMPEETILPGSKIA